MIRYRDGREVSAASGQDKLLARIYGSVWGRALLRPLVSPVVSKAAGAFLSSPLSCFLIKPFIEKNGIDMAQYEAVRYRSYNEFFSRKIRRDARAIDMQPDTLIAPCDSKLTVLPIGEDCRFTLKHTPYTVASLLRDEALAKRYEGGYALIFRLTVDDYHRYSYVADGEKGENVRIPGVLHTVNPVANDHYPIYKENSREYSVLHTGVFGDVLMMEVGALLVAGSSTTTERRRLRAGRRRAISSSAVLRWCCCLRRAGCASTRTSSPIRRTALKLSSGWAKPSAARRAGRLSE